VWDVDVCEAKEIKRVEIAYEGHTNKVSCIDFSGHHLITGSWDQTIRYPTPHTHARTTVRAVTECVVLRVVLRVV
jgi:WD40 repeat protein